MSSNAPERFKFLDDMGASTFEYPRTPYGALTYTMSVGFPNDIEADRAERQTVFDEITDDEFRDVIYQMLREFDLGEIPEECQGHVREVIMAGRKAAWEHLDEESRKRGAL